MSRPLFSRKRKGKKVDPYPLGAKPSSKTEQTKRSSRGRPKKAKPEPHPGKTVLTFNNPGNYNEWQIDLMLREELVDTDQVLRADKPYKCRSLTPRGVYPKQVEVKYFTKDRERKTPLYGSLYLDKDNTDVWTKEEIKNYRKSMRF